MLAKIHAISRANMDAQFRDAFTNRFAVADIASLNLPQTDTNASLGHLVSQPFKSLGERLIAIFAPISAQFDHGHIVALKLHFCLRASSALQTPPTKKPARGGLLFGWRITSSPDTSRWPTARRRTPPACACRRACCWKSRSSRRRPCRPRRRVRSCPRSRCRGSTN